MMNYFVLIISIYSLALNVLAYVSMRRIHASGCPCTDDWRRLYVQYSVLGDLIMIVIGTGLFGVSVSGLGKILAKLGSMAMMASYMPSVVVTLSYMWRLEGQECSLAPDCPDWTVWYVKWGYYGLVALIAISAVMG